tara:strand:- start:236 stop:541 length:306 start_codon:yes stop_codon:yes gene_type:complete
METKSESKTEHITESESISEPKIKSKKKSNKNKNKNHPIFYERCLVCKSKTNFHISTPISSRKWFVIGMGQLCSSCYMATYNTSTTTPVDETDDLWDLMYN